MQILFLAIKCKTSEEFRSAFVKVVTEVVIKFDCLQIYSSLFQNVVMIYSQDIHVLVLSAYVNFLD